MSFTVVKRMGDFFNGLSLESDVISFSSDSVNTTLVVKELFHIRAFEQSNPESLYVNDNRLRKVLIDGSEYNVIAVDYDNNTVTVSGVLTEASKYQVPNPFYRHGTLVSTSEEIAHIPDSEKFPMIYINEIIKEEMFSPLSNYDRKAMIRIAFLDYYENDWTRENHYRTSIAALCNLSEFIRKKLYKPSCVRILETDSISQANVPKWGKIVKSNTKDVASESHFLNETIDAVEWNVNIHFCKC